MPAQAGAQALAAPQLTAFLQVLADHRQQLEHQALHDPLTGLPNAADLTWTITYHVDVLSRGEDDFSPFVMYLDTSSGMGKPWIAMDQAFFPMQDGTRTVFKVKMAPSPNYSLVYTWGWRMHPPRAQVMENAHKQVTAFTNPCDSSTGTTQTTQQWEISVFGPDPRGSEANKLAAIAKIGDLAPEKKMWTALRAARSAAAQRKWLEVRRQGTLGKEAWFDGFKKVVERYEKASGRPDASLSTSRTPDSTSPVSDRSNGALTNDIDNLAQSLQQTVSQIVTSLLTLVGAMALMALGRPSARPRSASGPAPSPGGARRCSSSGLV